MAHHFGALQPLVFRGVDYPFWGIKQYKFMVLVILINFPYNSAMFGLVSYNDHCQRSQPQSPKKSLPQKNPEIFRTESES